MSYITTMTQKGQVTIPLEIRKYLGINPREKVLFTQINDQVTISPATNFLLLRGSVPSKEYSDAAADQKILSFVKKDYAK